MIALGISALIFYLYVTYCLFQYNLTKSISITYYKHSKGERWMFIAFMFAFSTALAISANSWLFYLAMGFAWLTGIAADSKKSKLLLWLHLISSFGMISIGTLGLYFHFGQIALPVIGGMGIASLWIPKVLKRTWLIEVWAFIYIAFGIYIHHIT